MFKIGEKVKLKQEYINDKLPDKIYTITYVLVDLVEITNEDFKKVVPYCFIEKIKEEK